MIVLKIGGSQVVSPEMEAVWAYVRAVREAGTPILLVHGGGPQSTVLAKQLGHTPEVIQGRRVTTDLDLQIVQWVIRGELNSRLAAQAYAAGIAAVGISGVDSGLVTVTRRPPVMVEGRLVDFGWVGDVVEVRPELPQAIMQAGYTPIIATMGVDAQGQIFNVNGDTVALHIAQAVRADRLLLLTDSGGLRKNVDDPASHFPVCNRALIEDGIAQGWIQGGMMVKVKEALKALDGGIGEVLMIRAGDVLSPEKGTRIIA